MFLGSMQKSRHETTFIVELLGLVDSLVRVLVGFTCVWTQGRYMHTRSVVQRGARLSEV